MQINPKLISIGNFPFAKLNKRKSELKSQGVKIYDFDIGDPKEATPKFIIEALKENIPDISQYPNAAGTDFFKLAVKNYLARRFNADLDTEQIAPTLGSKEAIYNITALFANSNKNLLLAPDPGYFVMAKSALMHGLDFQPYQLSSNNSYLFELADLSPDILKRIVACWMIYPHMPTGISCDLEYYRRQFEIAQKYDIILLSDETYVDFYFNTPPPSLLEISTKNVIAFHSCSKRSGMTGYRSGFIAGDPELVRSFVNFRNTSGSAMAEFLQKASAAAWLDDQHVVERRKIFKKKKDLLCNFLDRKKYNYLKTDATFYLWVETPDQSDCITYADFLLENGIAVCPGSFFGNGANKFFRISLSPNIDELEQAIKHWETL